MSGGGTRAILAGGGVAAFWSSDSCLQAAARPYVARRDLSLAADRRGEVMVEPRAIERVAEVAAKAHPAISAARGRYSVDDLTVDVNVRRARDVAQILQSARGRIVEALEQHELSAMPVNHPARL